MTYETVNFVLKAETGQAISSFGSFLSALKQTKLEIGFTKSKVTTLAKEIKHSGENSKKADNSLKKLNNEVKNTKENTKKAADSSSTLASALKNVFSTQNLITAGKAVVNQFSAFQREMTKMSFLAKDSEVSLEDMAKSAQELGASTGYGATKIMATQNALLTLGITTKDARNNMDVFTDFDKANGLNNLEDSAKKLGSVVQNLGKEYKYTADIMTKAMKITGVNSTYLSDSLSSIGECTKKMGLEKTSALIGVMSDSFSDGKKAGKALEAMFKDFGNTKKMAKFGIEVDNKTSPEEKIKAINEALKDKAPAEQQKILKEIFSDVGRTAYYSLQGAEDKVKAFVAEINNSKISSEEMANAFDNDLLGKLNILKGSTETLAVCIGSRFSDSLAVAADALINLINTGCNLIINWDNIYKSHEFLIDSAYALISCFLTYKAAIKISSEYQKLHDYITKEGTIANRVFTAGLRTKNFIMREGSLATRTLAFAQKALNAAFNSNPLITVIGGLILLGAGVRYAIKHFEWLRKGIKTIGKVFKNHPLIYFIGKIIDKFEFLKKAASGVGNLIKNIFGWKEEPEEIDNDNSISNISKENKQLKDIIDNPNSAITSDKNLEEFKENFEANENYTEQQNYGENENYKITSSNENSVNISPNFAINIYQSSNENNEMFIDSILEKMKKEVSESIISGARLAGIL